MRKDWLILIALLLFSLPAVKSLLIPGGFTSHDLTHHVVRQISMDRLLSEGQFPPRWSGELNNGYGYPVFLFNYPLPAMVGEVFHLMGLGYVDSVKAVLFTSMVISVMGMYLFLNSLLKSKMSAFLGAIFYLYAPTRFLNVYVSASVGSASALAVIPFIFWAIMRGRLLLGSIFLAALIISHNVTALMFTPVILVFAFLFKQQRVIQMFLLGLGLSAWFWMPAIFEAQYTRFNELFGNFYKDQFPSVWQLLRSPWGYGLSHPQRPEPGDMSYQLGLIHILVMLMFIPMVWTRRKVRVIGGFALAVFAISIFLILKVSMPIWEKLPFLSLVQFPLRFSAIAIFSAAIAAALLVKYLPLKKFLFVTLLILVIYANRNHWNINQVFDPGEDYYLGLKTTSTTYGEHLPRWGKDYGRSSLGKMEIIRGFGEVRVVREKSAQVLAEVETTTAAKLRFNQIYFPGWEIKVDGQKANFNYLSDSESYGLPIFDIKKGRHTINAEFKNTPIRNLADLISIVTLIIWTYLLISSIISVNASRSGKTIHLP